MGLGGMAQRLGATVTFSKDPAPTLGGSQLPVTPALGYLTPSSPLWAATPRVYAHIQKHTY